MYFIYVQISIFCPLLIVVEVDIICGVQEDTMKESLGLSGKQNLFFSFFARSLSSLFKFTVCIYSCKTFVAM